MFHSLNMVTNKMRRTRNQPAVYRSFGPAVLHSVCQPSCLSYVVNWNWCWQKGRGQVACATWFCRPALFAAAAAFVMSRNLIYFLTKKDSQVIKLASIQTFLFTVCFSFCIICSLLLAALYAEALLSLSPNSIQTRRWLQIRFILIEIELKQ